jgi:hypothetical protein
LSLGSCGLVWRAIKYPSSVAGRRARQDRPWEGLRGFFLTAARSSSLAPTKAVRSYWEGGWIGSARTRNCKP